MEFWREQLLITSKVGIRFRTETHTYLSKRGFDIIRILIPFFQLIIFLCNRKIKQNRHRYEYFKWHLLYWIPSIVPRKTFEQTVEHVSASYTYTSLNLLCLYLFTLFFFLLFVCFYSLHCSLCKYVPITRQSSEATKTKSPFNSYTQFFFFAPKISLLCL